MQWAAVVNKRWIPVFALMASERKSLVKKMDSRVRGNDELLKSELLWLGVILLAAVVTRMGWPGITEFKADEARLLTLAWDMAEGKYFPIRGISNSAGSPNPPMAVWLYALPLLVWKHVYAATLYTGLLNVLAVGGSWWMARRYWGSTAALVAAALLTANPWAIHHARKIWAQNLILPFVVGWGICGLLVYVERRHWFLIGHFLCLAIGVQAHLAVISLVPATLLLLIIFWRRVDWRAFIVGAGLSIVTALPFVWHLWRSGESVSGGGVGGGFSAETFRLFFHLSTGDQIHVLTGSSFQEFMLATPNLWWAYVGLLGLMGVGLWRVVQRCETSDIFILVWLAWSVLFFAWEFAPVVLHYVMPVYPLPFLLAGIGVVQVGESLSNRRFLHSAAYYLVGFVVAGQLWTFGVLLRTVATEETFGGFGTPVRIELAAVEETLRLREESGAFEILVVSDGAFPAVDDVPAVYDVLLRGVPHRFVDGNTTAVFPAGRAVQLVVRGEELRGADVLAARAAEAVRVPLRDPSQSITSYVVSGQPTPERPFNPSFTLANFVQLEGYGGERVGDWLIWRLYWRVGAGGDADYHWFNHLVDGGGRVAQADEAAFHAGAWREGDLVVSFFELADAPDEWRSLAMRSGMYRFPSLEAVPVLDVAGNAAGDFAEYEIQE